MATINDQSFLDKLAYRTRWATVRFDLFLAFGVIKVSGTVQLKARYPAPVDDSLLKAVAVEIRKHPEVKRFLEPDGTLDLSRPEKATLEIGGPVYTPWPFRYSSAQTEPVLPYIEIHQEPTKGDKS